MLTHHLLGHIKMSLLLEKYLTTLFPFLQQLKKEFIL